MMSPSRPRLLVTGATGQVGWELVRALQPVGIVHGLGRDECDLTDLAAIQRVMLELQPTVVFNAAAYTAVDDAEREPDLAMRINRDAVGVIGQAARSLDAAVVHFSTDYVFDGRATQAYRETDAPDPLNVYGRTKLAGEQALARTGAAHITFRTSWVYAMRGRNFVRTILKLAREREALQVVSDQWGTPTWARWLAEACAQIVGSLVRDPRGAVTAFREAGGVVHMTGAGKTTWHGFAEAILTRDSLSREHVVKRVEAVTSATYRRAAERPLNAVLDGSKLESKFRIIRTHWADQLSLAMQADGA